VRRRTGRLACGDGGDWSTVYAHGGPPFMRVFLGSVAAEAHRLCVDNLGLPHIGCGHGTLPPPGPCRAPDGVRELPRRDPWELIQESLAIEAQEAQEAGSLAYMARVFAQTSMPYRDPGNLPAWGRRNGVVSLVMQQGHRIGEHQEPEPIGYPYGTIPRLLMAWISTEAVRTRQRELSLGRSLSGFMGELGLVPTGGRWGSVTRVRSQTERLFSAAVTTRWELDEFAGAERMDVATRWQLWWSARMPDAVGLFESTVTLSESFYEQLVTRPVPIDFRAIRALRGSPLRLDIYMWLTHRMSYLRQRTVIPWERLRLQFGSTFANTAKGRNRFREDFTKHLMQVLIVYSAAQVDVIPGGLVLHPSRPHVRRRSG
jgi:hypothetical protein